MIRSIYFLISMTLISLTAQAGIKEYSVDYQGGGSDGYRRPSDPAGVFFSISDRGPNVDCKDAEDLLQSDPCPGDDTGKIFLQPDYQPRILKWKWTGKGQPQLLETILLKDAQGRPVTGLPNPYFAPEIPYGPEGEVLDFDPSGIDPEGLVVMSDDSFWVSEEYGPSLLHVSPQGTILERWVPENLMSYYKQARYSVLGKLPAVFGLRRSNRGFESLALSPDGKKLWLANQSPLANPSESVAKKSRIVRILSISLEGSEAKEAVGMYAYEFEDAKEFESGAKAGDLKLSAMLFKGKKLLIQERTDSVVKIFEVELGKNILSTDWNKVQASPTLEEKAPKNLLAKKTIIWDSQDEDEAIALKIEAMVDWSGDKLLLLNDDDFGVTDQTSKLFLLNISGL